MQKNKIIGIIFGIVFFVVGIITLPHYGINWDTINHLPRGQAYLHYFLTGSHDYSNLPPFFKEWQQAGQWYWQRADTLLYEPDVEKGTIPRVSLYQGAGVNFDYFMQRDGGHPPLSDILSSVFNLVLFQKLGIVNDIDSYRVYGITLAAMLVGLLYYWVSKVYGSLAGVVSALSLSLYPLFWSESHFNTEKDIPETVYWSFLLFSVWKGVTGRSWKWILTSGVMFGLALGTKFNIAFIPFIIIPWILLTSTNLLKQKWFWISSMVAGLIGLSMFVGLWPYLWADPIERIRKVMGFYKGIGLTDAIDPRFTGPFGINLYPITAIIYTTPLITLGLALVGLIRAIKLPKKERDFLILVGLWLLVPILRVTWPGTTIYGGLRQIMEYIPALAIMSGIGAKVIYDFLVKRVSKRIAAAVLIIPFIFLTVKLSSIHPNENVYFNPLIGGLAGAKSADFPFWGNSFGAAYRQGINWINENAEEGSKVAYAYELIPNMPRIWLRTDLNLTNKNRSGYLRAGEYVITLPYRGTEKRSYFDMYLHKFMTPVYESKVDGVSVVTIWKNDSDHLKKPWNELRDTSVKLEKKPESLFFDLGEIRSVSRLEINYREGSCVDMKHGFARISVDGVTWTGLPGALPNDWLIPFIGQQPSGGSFIYPFTGQEVRFIELVVSPVDACISKNLSSYKVYYLSD